MRPAILTALALALSPAALAYDGTPVQGQLRNAAGPVTDGLYTVKVGLWTAESAGTLVWSEIHPAVPVGDGLFSLKLGAFTALPTTLWRDHDALWVSVSVEQEPELPRRPLSAVPWAEVAAYAHEAGALACTGCVGASQLGITQDEHGSLALLTPDGLGASALVQDAAGFVGVSQPAPVVALDVGGAIRVAATTAECSPALEGAIQYDKASKQLRFCNGLAWAAVGGSFEGLSRVFQVQNPNGSAVSDYQLRVDVADFIAVYGPIFEVLAPGGAAVPYCFEQPSGECGKAASNVVWVKLPTLAASSSAAFVFQKAAASGVDSAPEVFDFYEDFGAPIDLVRWQIATDTCTPSVSGGELRSGAQNANNRECGLMSSSALLSESVTLETRITIAATGTSDADPIVAAVSSDFTTTATQNNAAVGWVCDDEGPTHSLYYGTGQTTSFSSTNIRGTTSVVAVQLHGGQVRACLTLDGTCSTFQARGTGRDRIFVGSTAFGGIPWSYDWVRVRRYAPSALTGTWQ